MPVSPKSILIYISQLKKQNVQVIDDEQTLACWHEDLSRVCLLLMKLCLIVQMKDVHITQLSHQSAQQSEQVGMLQRDIQELQVLLPCSMPSMLNWGN